MNPVTYVLVADGNKAKVYKSEVELLAGLQLVQERDNKHSSAGHSFHGEKDSHRHAEEKFAQELCTQLNADRIAGKFTELMIAAPPHLLGALRSHLSHDCQKVLSKTVDKDLLRNGPRELREHFR
jgi:protein required for attachment to host cells